MTFNLIIFNISFRFKIRQKLCILLLRAVHVSSIFEFVVSLWWNFILSLSVFCLSLWWNFVLSLYVFCLLFHCDRTRLYYVASSMLSCYFIVTVRLKQEKTKKKKKQGDLCMVFFLSGVLCPFNKCGLRL